MSRTHPSSTIQQKSNFFISRLEKNTNSIVRTLELSTNSMVFLIVHKPILGVRSPNRDVAQFITDILIYPLFNTISLHLVKKKCRKALTSYWWSLFCSKAVFYSNSRYANGQSCFTYYFAMYYVWLHRWRIASAVCFEIPFVKNYVDDLILSISRDGRDELLRVFISYVHYWRIKWFLCLLLRQ